MIKELFTSLIRANQAVKLTQRRLTTLVAAAAMFASLLFSAAPLSIAYASGSFLVNSTSDFHCSGFVSQSNPSCTAATGSGGFTSLRSALEFASTSGGGNTITLPGGTYNLSLGDLVAGTQANTNITITGAGAASTTINQTTAGKMVFVVNYNVSPTVVFSLSGVTVSGGSENENDPDGFGGNGGAILAGGSVSATGNSVSITNVTFSGNYCSPVSNAGCSGGAISMTGGGNLTVNGSTFTGNTASKNSGFGAGGAIYFDNGGNPGNVSITNTTFTNNTAQGNSTTGGQGGAVRLSGGTGTTYTLTNNTFTGNAANGTTAAGANGGAITLISGSLTANFNRIIGNTSANGSGLFVGNNAGTVGGAINNWWGCNTGPNAAPCDTAVLGTPNQGGSMTFNPWIVLTNTASPNPIQVNQTTTLTASFLQNSSAGILTTSQISQLIGLPVTWGSPVKGALSGAQTSIQANGTATAVFTANAAGAGSAGATVDSGTATASITINKADTTTTLLTDTPDPSVTGQAVAVTYSMTSNTGSSPTAPTGSVTVSDGTSSCTGTLAAGTCNITLTSAGSKMLTATYNGDSNFNTSTSAGAAHTVNKADTTTTITSDNPDPSVVGQSVTIQYGVSTNAPGSGTPTGNVTVSDGSVSCTGTVSAGQCSITFTSAGSKSLTATYAGDSNYNGSTSASAAHSVNKADTTTSIISDNPDPSDAGQAVTVNYSVAVTSPGAGTPTGNVTVSDGINTCTGTVAAGTCNITLTTQGARTLTATYAGDSNFNGSTSAGEAHTVNNTATTTVITSDTPDPSVVGQSVPVQYSVTPSGSGTPTGNVTVSDGTISCTGTVAAGQCSLTFTSAGAKSLTATYAGDNSFSGSTSAAESHQVNPADTTTTITADNPDPSVVGQSVTVNFSVTPNSPGTGTPTGNVTVSDGTISCTGTVAAGQCILTFTSAGAKSLTATYAGDSNFNGSTSAAEAHQVNKANTTTTITSDNPDPSSATQAVAVNFTVTANAPGSGIPTGNVTVSDGVNSCTGTVLSGGCAVTLTTGGNRTLTATYAGDSNFNGSTSAGEPHVVDNTPPSVTINQAAGQADPTNTTPILFTVVFSEPVTGFDASDISLGGTATPTNANVTGGPTTFSVSVSGMSGNGTVTVSVPANAATDLVGNPNAASTSIDNTVTYDVEPPSVTINQAAGQADPTSSGTINFTAVFSEPVTGFAPAGVSLSGTAGATTSVITQIAPNDGTTYNVAVSGMSLAGTVTASVNANAATDLAGNPNTASTSTDNTVTFNPDTTPPDTIIDTHPTNPTTNTSAAFTFHGTDNLTPAASLTFECSLDGSASSACTSPKSYTGLGLGSHTFQVRAIDAANNVDPTPTSFTWQIHANTSLLYNGGQIVNIGGSFTPAALLSSPASACVGGKTINFSLDSNPLTGAVGTYPLGSATTNSSGQATMSPVGTTGWLEGIYYITAKFGGTVACNPSTYQATLTVASPGDSASGGGWYTLSGSGRINFGFTVRKTDSACLTNCTYKGQFLLINNGKWRLKGTLGSYVKLSTGQGAASGIGDLYWWNQSLNGGLGDWALAKAGASFTINFFDSGLSGKSSTDMFGINIQYAPVPPQPSTLPNSSPQLLKGGNIVVK